MATLSQQIEQKKKEISDGVYSDISIVKLQKELSDLYEAFNIKMGYKVGDYLYDQYGGILEIVSVHDDGYMKINQYYPSGSISHGYREFFGYEKCYDKISKETFEEIVGNWKNFNKVIDSLEDQIKSLLNNISDMQTARDEQTKQILLKIDNLND